MLDEPTASLPADEVVRLFGALRRLREHGVGMIYVSHRLDEVFEIADRMVVLRDGKVAGERIVAQTTPEETILLIVGREPSQMFKRPAEREGAPRLEFAQACFGAVGPIDASIHAGEIVGLVGLRGAGQETVSRALFGVEPITGGTYSRRRRDGRRSARRARRWIWASISSARIGSASRSCRAFPCARISSSIRSAPGRSRRPGFRRRAECADAKRIGETVGLRPNDPSLAIELLSGGNQQKVVVGRWLSLKSKIYVFEDPTAGVDVGAKAEIYKLFDVALKGGAAILIVSTDFEEVSKVCHRALVFDRGRVRARAACRRSLDQQSARRRFRHHRDDRGRGDIASLTRGRTMQIDQVQRAGADPARTRVDDVRAGHHPPAAGLWPADSDASLIVVFSILLPDTFPTWLNVSSILADKSIVALLALAATLPMMAGRIDLTVGFGIVMWHILAISFQVKYGIPWPVAILIVVACAGVVGLINGLLVEVAQVDAFVATLGTGTILYALALWHTDGRQIIGTLPPGFVAINTASLFGIPIPAFYVLGLAIVLWIVSERLPIGRFIYAIGANEKAAALNGIPVRAYVIGVFVASGVIMRPRRLRAGRETAHRASQCRPRFPAARAGRRVSRLHHDQAGPRKHLGHGVRHSHSGDRHFRHPAVRRRLLRRAPVQRHDARRRHRARRLRATSPHCRQAAARGARRER